MKKFLSVLLLSMSSFAFAVGGPSYPEVELNLHLSLDKLCGPGTPLCNDFIISLGGAKVILVPQDGSFVCSDDDNNEDHKSEEEQNCEWQDITHYRGIWSDVAENDGLRSIGIVSIDKHIMPDFDNDGKPNERYLITGEILTEKGVEAKIKISTENLNTLNDVELEGSVISQRTSNYQASLVIGRSRVLRPIPCPPTGCGQDEKSYSSHNKIELIKGSIKK